MPRGKEKKHDEFIDWTMHVLMWIKNHWAGLLELLGIGVIAIVVIMGANAYGKGRAEKAAAALYAAHQVAADSENRTKALQDVVDDYPRTFAGKSALMELGNGQLKKKEYDAAIESFRLLADRTRNQSIFRIAALHQLAMAQVAKGDFTAAAETYRKAAADPGNQLSLMSELHAGICLERAGDVAAAAELYKRIIKDAGDNDRAARDASEERLLWLMATKRIAG